MIADDIAPSELLELPRPAGLAVARGSPMCHLAILARARGVPLITGLDPGVTPGIGETALLDADAGLLLLAPRASDLPAAGARANVVTPARAAPRSSGGFAAVRPASVPRLLVNIDGPSDLDPIPCNWDGVGLMRSEAAFARGPVDEAAQRDLYATVLARAEGRPVTIRTLDAGGDKPLTWLGRTPTANPALGLRGIRLSLAEPELFRTQLRALAQAAAQAPDTGPLSVILPFLTVPGELEAARGHLEAVCADLGARGVAHRRPALGVMIETPAAALTAAAFDAAFLAIGGNDLAQHVLAVARDDPEVAGLADPAHPALAELYARIVAVGQAQNIPVGFCGEVAADPARLPGLLELGLSSLSVAPHALPAIARALGRAGQPA
ncbi:MAG: putative PEP-binding protein [Pseudomonadota bacterium]